MARTRGARQRCAVCANVARAGARVRARSGAQRAVDASMHAQCVRARACAARARAFYVMRQRARARAVCRLLFSRHQLFYAATERGIIVRSFFMLRHAALRGSEFFFMLRHAFRQRHVLPPLMMAI